MPEDALIPLAELDHEELLIRRGTRSGCYTIVAVHSTTLGPALGGCRMWRYESSAEGARDALRLARGMTFKSAAAGIPLGGGKGVICAPPGGPPVGDVRRKALLDFADTVEALDGRYVTAEDVGVSVEDLAMIKRVTDHVAGLSAQQGGSGDPSPVTALGVAAAIHACCELRFGTRDMKGRSVSIVGVGRVGSELARLLADAGARLVLSDVNQSRAELVHQLPDATFTDPASGLVADVDVLAPCALGGAIDEYSIGTIRCQVVCGAANNQLAHDGLAEDLLVRDILYGPDFIANAGGIINIAEELRGYDKERAYARVRDIERTMAQVLERAQTDGTTTLAAANALARARLAA